MTRHKHTLVKRYKVALTLIKITYEGAGAFSANSNVCNLYYKNILTIVSDGYTINVFKTLALASVSVINYDSK